MSRKSTRFIAIHCSATPPSLDVGVKEIDRWHKERGFLGVGYHRVVRRDGTCEQGRPDDQVGAHVEGFNSVSIGVCLVGGVDDKGKPENNFTPEQFSALKTVIKELTRKYPGAIVQGHRDFPHVAKDCPSFDVTEWMVKELMNDIDL